MWRILWVPVKVYCLIVILISLLWSFSAMAGSYLDTQKNQIIFVQTTNKITNITTRWNISPSGSEKECLSYLKKRSSKTCISYQIVVPNYDDRFGLFIKQELWAQELMWKTLFLYDFRTQKIINVMNLVVSDIQSATNYWMWYSSWEISYTVWTGNSYSTPKSIDPSIFSKVTQ